ncbi:Penicillin-binding protein 2 [Verrucomicrobia bacterium]|nr:Penicillin-binding protein 2 [Verrucomicrobiota bacterium]
MLFFDQLKKNDPQLRLVAMVFLAGLGILLAGLWWVQVVSVREYQANLETQSFRSVRIPAVRGKILDRSGVALAENQPIYNVSLYLDELHSDFDMAYAKKAEQVRAHLKAQAAEQEKALHRKLKPEEKRQFVLSVKDKNLLRQQARFEVASNVVLKISQRLNQPPPLHILANFERHYQTRLALPFEVLTNLDQRQIACLAEQTSAMPGVDLEVQSLRVYPLGTTASHVLGRLTRDESSQEGEEAFFSYRLPDYRGKVGIEYGFDRQLRGVAGAKSVLVNNLGYRQTENVWSPAEAGQNVVVCLDSYIQQAAERALPIFGPATHGAVIVMDVNTGDILAMASSPTLNPNFFVQGFPPGEYQQISSMRAEMNLCTQENYQPGSIFKTVVGMAALEAGLDPEQTFAISADPQRPDKAMIRVGSQTFHDTAPPGDFNFRRALKLSSNSYFISNGLRTGIENIARLAHRLHLGERTGMPTRQEVSGRFPTLHRVENNLVDNDGHNWFDGDTANLCIGQGPIAVTPLQMAVMTAAIANGGKVLWPRLVDRIEPQDPTSNLGTQVFPSAQVRDELGVKPRTLQLLREAMLADVEDADGTGRQARVPNLRICGKTGTSQKKDASGKLEEHVTWFASFAPYETPHYAVLVMVEVPSGILASGGGDCAPIARKIYTAILERERLGTAKLQSVAKGN